FEIPKGSGKGTIFAGNLWIGGIDIGGQLKLAAETYKQSGTDFWPGPLDTTNATITHTNSLAWNKVWKINKSTIDSFRLGILNPIPQNILNWPGNGDPSMGQAQNLAPYVDVNGDNIYNPTAGDFPCIKGDQCVYFIFNDSELGSVHGTGGLRFGIEIHGMAYAFNNLADTSLGNTIFINYRLINRSTFQYDSLCIGNFTDLNLGCYSDDMFGTDVERSAYQVYNGDNDDDTVCTGGGYGKFPPAQAVVFLKGPEADVNDGKDNDHNCIVDELQEEWIMSNSLFYRNINAVPYGNPQTPLHYYNYLRSIWGDGMHLKYDSGYGYSTVGPDCNYIFPGSPTSDKHDWGIGGNCST
ncbi:MAG: hypothetical protein IT440_16460, partial [Phycisphaeraceae bacterium]|nr:hypothetical protein [Phycisphaeraceae bacterium]